jgi:hypothetical protein
MVIGLILLATAAGAPFLPKLAEVAKGNIAFGVGLMVLLMVVTIIYLRSSCRSCCPAWRSALGRLIILMPLGGELGKRSGAATEAADPSA